MLKRESKVTKDYQKVRFIFHVSEPSAKHQIHFDKQTRHSNQHYILFDRNMEQRKMLHFQKKNVKVSDNNNKRITQV